MINIEKEKVMFLQFLNKSTIYIYIFLKRGKDEATNIDSSQEKFAGFECNCHVIHGCLLLLSRTTAVHWVN